MTRIRKPWIAAALVALAVTIALCWPRPRGYTYQGKTVEEWWEEFNRSYRPDTDGLSPAHLWQAEARWESTLIAFGAMGTNAAPFLAMRIKDIELSLIEKWRWKLPEPFHPVPHRVRDATRASILLAHCAKCPIEMLQELLKPVLTGSNDYARTCAIYATNSYITNSFGKYEGLPSPPSR